MPLEPNAALSRKGVSRKRLVIAGVGLLFGFGVWMLFFRTPNAPEGVQLYPNTQHVLVRPTIGDEWPEPAYQVTQFAKLTSGEIVAPIIRVIRPKRSGFMGATRYHKVWETTYHAMGAMQAKLELPVAPEIESHVVLVRRISSVSHEADDPWRVWSFTPKDVSGGLVMPRFADLTRLTDRNDANELLRKDRSAKEFLWELDR